MIGERIATGPREIEKQQIYARICRRTIRDIAATGGINPLSSKETEEWIMRGTVNGARYIALDSVPSYEVVERSALGFGIPTWRYMLVHTLHGREPVKMPEELIQSVVLPGQLADRASMVVMLELAPLGLVCEAAHENGYSFLRRGEIAVDGETLEQAEAGELRDWKGRPYADPYVEKNRRN